MIEPIPCKVEESKLTEKEKEIIRTMVTDWTADELATALEQIPSSILLATINDRMKRMKFKLDVITGIMED